MSKPEIQFLEGPRSIIPLISSREILS